MTHIPYGRQDIDAEDIRSVVAVLRGDWLTQGPMVPRFEAAIASYCSADFAVAANSATSALHLACLALDVGPGDVVWTSAITFVASANCARHCGADIDFVDIDPDTWNMSVDALQAKLETAAAVGRVPKVIIPVHFGGQSCDMSAIADLAEQYGFRVIEDAAHSLGGTYLGGRVGCCRYSDVSVFSFHPVKSITTGEGGMATTNDEHLASRMEMLRAHGRDRDGQQVALGFNFRMTDIQAALGLSQLRRLDELVTARAQLAAVYDDAFCCLPIRLPLRGADGRSAHHIYPIRVASELRDPLVERFHSEDIAVRLHYPPVYLQPYYESLGFGRGLCLEAEAYAAEAITLPLFPSMRESAQARVIEACRKEFWRKDYVSA
jgi:UDP-4-amino-4,6-dideoxy-N-acetyl-beta-L-altrosamine transaminase